MEIIARTERLLLRTLTYLPMNTIKAMQQNLPDSALDVLLRESVREYILELPIC